MKQKIFNLIHLKKIFFCNRIIIDMQNLKTKNHFVLLLFLLVTSIVAYAKEGNNGNHNGNGNNGNHNGNNGNNGNHYGNDGYNPGYHTEPIGAGHYNTEPIHSQGGGANFFNSGSGYGGPSSVPIDGGLSLLALAGVAYTARKARKLKPANTQENIDQPEIK